MFVGTVGEGGEWDPQVQKLLQLTVSIGKFRQSHVRQRHIRMNEFVHFFVQFDTEEDAQALFRRIDRHRNGSLSRKDIIAYVHGQAVQLAETYGPNYQRETEVQLCFHTYSRPGDGAAVGHAVMGESEVQDMLQTLLGQTSYNDDALLKLDSQYEAHCILQRFSSDEEGRAYLLLGDFRDALDDKKYHQLVGVWLFLLLESKEAPETVVHEVGEGGATPLDGLRHAGGHAVARVEQGLERLCSPRLCDQLSFDDLCPWARRPPAAALPQTQLPQGCALC